jgi:CHASE3 domain sensor protein
MKKQLLILPILIGMTLFGFSQTSTTKIIDLTVNSTTYADTAGTIITNSGLDINFKVNDQSTANKVFILFGTQQNLGDVKTSEALFTQSGSDYFLTYNGNQYPITEGMANISIELSQTELDNFNYITVYIEDNQGIDTNKLYFNKQ